MLILSMEFSQWYFPRDSILNVDWTQVIADISTSTSLSEYLHIHHLVNEPVVFRDVPVPWQARSNWNREYLLEHFPSELRGVKSTCSEDGILWYWNKEPLITMGSDPALTSKLTAQSPALFNIESYSFLHSFFANSTREEEIDTRFSKLAAQVTMLEQDNLQSTDFGQPAASSPTSPIHLNPCPYRYVGRVDDLNLWHDLSPISALTFFEPSPDSGLAKQPPFAANDALHRQTRLWFGSHASTSPLHHDPFYNLYYVVQGGKQVFKQSN